MIKRYKYRILTLCILIVILIFLWIYLPFGPLNNEKRDDPDYIGMGLIFMAGMAFFVIPVIFGLGMRIWSLKDKINNELEQEAAEQAKRKEQEEASAQRKEWARVVAQREMKEKRCPKCGYYPLNKRSNTVSKEEVVRNIKHIFLREVPVPGYYSIQEHEVVNVVLAPQNGKKLVVKELITCPKCGYRKESKPTKKYKWDGPDEIKEVIRVDDRFM